MRLKKKKKKERKVFSYFINCCGTHIDDCQRPSLINCDPLTYHLVPSLGQDYFWANTPAGKNSIDQHQKSTYAGLASDWLVARPAYVVFWCWFWCWSMLFFSSGDIAL